MEPIKVITVWQPWATLIALQEKWNETRGWPTEYRGPLAIHAAKKIDYEACENPVIKSVLAKHGYTADNLPTGVIVAKCNLIGCHEVMSVDFGIATLMTDDFKKVAGNEFKFGFYERGRFAWELGEVQPLPYPIPAKGQQRLWNWDEMGRIKALNSLTVTDWSSGLGELEYVIAKKTGENLRVLREAGFTESELAEATDNDESDIDLATLAFNYAGAAYWTKEDGFSTSGVWRKDKKTI